VPEDKPRKWQMVEVKERKVLITDKIGGLNPRGKSESRDFGDSPGAGERPKGGGSEQTARSKKGKQWKAGGVEKGRAQRKQSRVCQGTNEPRA